MSELTITALRLGLLVVLWLFVLSVVGVLRGDLYGTRAPRGTSRPDAQSAPDARPVTTPRRSRRTPRTLVVTDGPLTGTSLPLDDTPVTLGRNPSSTLVLEDDYASGQHARLYPEDGRWYVEDLGSTNGTVLGRDPLTGPRPVEAGATLRIGTTVLELRS